MNFTSDVLDEAYILILIKILSWYPNTDFFFNYPKYNPYNTQKSQ